MTIKQGGVTNDAPGPSQLEDGSQCTIDELVEINLGTKEDPRLTFLSASITLQEHESYRQFLMESRVCFAWTYKDMPGLDPQVTTHKIAIDPQFRPVKQHLCSFRPELQDGIITTWIGLSPPDS